MGFSQDQKSERGGRLPEPELNPMMNPKLGENLGRWAQVYFTAAPEKRKEAVEELLRELESEDPDYVPPSLVTKIVECPSCHERNETGHRFCGMCGADLNGAARTGAAPFVERRESQPVADDSASTPPPVQEHEAFRPVPPAPIVERRIAPLPPEVEREIYRPASPTERRTAPAPVERAPVERLEEREVYRPAPPPPPRRDERDEDDVQWLRERTLVGLTEDDSQRSGLGKYLFIAILIIGAAFAGLEWASREPLKTVEVVQGGKPKTDTTPPQVNQEAPAPPADSQAVAAQKPPTKPQQSPATEKTATQSSSEQPSAEANAAQARVPASEKARIQRTSAAPSRTTAEPVAAANDSDMSGAQELSMAEGYLSGRYGNARNTSEAARWLWKSVAKQNTTASVLLANLYIQGDGVSKSCDQARLLLVAAAKKGSSTAAQNLRNIESGGCK